MQIQKIEFPNSMEADNGEAVPAWVRERHTNDGNGRSEGASSGFVRFDTYFNAVSI